MSIHDVFYNYKTLVKMIALVSCTHSSLKFVLSLGAKMKSPVGKAAYLYTIFPHLV